MKKLLFSVLMSLSLVSFADVAPSPVEDPIYSELIQHDISVKANSAEEYESVLSRKNLHGVKLCNVFNNPRKNVEVLATITNEAGEAVWIGSVTKNCTSLDTLPEPINFGEYGTINFKCRNFDSVDRVCKAKAAVYGK